MGLTVTFTGRRPKDLFGYYDKASYQRIVDKLKILLTELYNKEARTFISGGAQGFDQLTFWAVNGLKKIYPDIRNVLYIPHEKQSDVWKNDGLFSRDYYKLMLSLADEIKIISREYNIDTSYRDGIIRSLLKRNEAMIDSSDLIIGLYNHNIDFLTSKGGTAAALRYSMQNTNIGIIVIDPFTLCEKRIRTTL